MDPLDIVRELSQAAGRLKFGEPVACVYNPLDYAFAGQAAYVRRYARPGVPALLVGMNPGPFGMVQTGVPFGEVATVRDWLDIHEPVKRPQREHPKRPILGFDCPRSEVSGRRLWGWARDRFGAPEAFFERFFVWNYCPLAFMERSGRNLTPDKLPPGERRPLLEACDLALARIVEALSPRAVIGIGSFAEKRVRAALEGRDLVIGSILHPSPASPAANRAWAEQVEQQLRALGIEFPEGSRRRGPRPLARRSPRR